MMVTIREGRSSTRDKHGLISDLALNCPLQIFGGQEMSRISGLIRSMRIGAIALFNAQDHAPQKVAPSDALATTEGEYDEEEDDGSASSSPGSQRMSNVSEERDTLLGESSHERDEMELLPKLRSEPACNCPFINPFDHLVWSADEAANMSDEVCGHWANPLWWAVMLLLATGILCGKAVHSLFGQGGPVRVPNETDPSSETRQERQVRLNHCFMPDGLFALMGVLFFKNILGAQTHTEKISATVGLAVSSGYVLGNILFLAAMRWRSKVAVRIAIANNLSFCLALVTMLVNGGFHGTWPVSRVLSYINRGFVVLFFAMGLFHILPLWSSPVYQLPGYSCGYEVAGLAMVAMIAVSVWALLIVAAVQSESTVWEVAMNGA